MKNMTYTDVLSMPTYERRFFIGQLTRDNAKQEEQMERAREQNQASNGKGSRTKKISGDALKTRMKNGDVPLK
jgi:hypothetical protein